MLKQQTIGLPEASHEYPWLRQLMLVLGGSLLIALCARISIPLPFSPIPLSLQPHVCLFLGALFGRRLGSLAVLAYLLQGAVGMPVFALGHAGLGIILGPRGGYLMGYLLATWVTGYLVENSGSKSLRSATLAMAIGNLMIYLCGVTQLALYIGIQRSVMLGMLPFLFGDGLKLFFFSKALKALRFRKFW